jgi:dihydrofolate reductase
LISLIVAHANQNVIGFNGGMPWYLPADLKHVKSLTENNTIVMGRKTFESLGRPLPNRKNVVLTHRTDFNPEGVDVIHHIHEIEHLPGKIFIFGGSKIYEETLHLVSEMHITRIHETFAGDTFFPDYNLDDWQEKSRQEGKIDSKNKYPYEFIHYVRKKTL